MDKHIVEREPSAITFTAEEVERFVLDFIRQEHPEWVRRDGTCPKCLDYYARLDEIETVPASSSPAVA